MLALIATQPAWAGGYVSLSGAEIAAMLRDARIVYEETGQANGQGAWQEFRASGRTLYNAGRDSWGYWQVRGDEYCSQWPPGELWNCYAVTRDGARIRFIGASGDVSEGRIE